MTLSCQVVLQRGGGAQGVYDRLCHTFDFWAVIHPHPAKFPAEGSFCFEVMRLLHAEFRQGS